MKITSNLGNHPRIIARWAPGPVSTENLCHLGRFAGKPLGLGPAPGGRWAGLHPAVRAMIFGLWA
jgi:hypothetical protein